MAHEFEEGKLLLWMDAEAYEKIPFDNEGKITRAIQIYEHYIAEGAPHKIALDGPTLDELRAKFAKGSKTRLTAHKLTKVFNLVFGKVFQELKFNFLPRFLCSKGESTLKPVSATPTGSYCNFDMLSANCEIEFMMLSRFGTYFEKEAQVAETASQILGDMDIGYIMKNPFGTFYFQEFLYSTDSVEARQHHGVELYDLIHEIDDFQNAEDNDHRVKRAAHILTRFKGEELGISKLAKLNEVSLRPIKI